MKITKFVKGDIIIRTEPAVQYKEEYNSTLGIMQEIEVSRDNSYVGMPMRFIAVQNGVIYTEHLNEFWRTLKKGKAMLPEFTFEFGWEHFTLPEGFSWEDVDCVNPDELT